MKAFKVLVGVVAVAESHAEACSMVCGKLATNPSVLQVEEVRVVGEVLVVEREDGALRLM